MPRSFEEQQLDQLKKIFGEMHQIARIMEAMNENVVRIGRSFEAFTTEMTKDVDIDEVLEDAKKLEEIRAITGPMMVDANQLPLPGIVTSRDDTSWTQMKKEMNGE